MARRTLEQTEPTPTVELLSGFYTLTLRWNYDTRQTTRVRARTVESLQEAVTKAIKRDEPHNCDGLTLGDCDEISGDEYVIVMSRNESDDSWEIERTNPIGMAGRDSDGWIEYGTFEEVCIIFLEQIADWIAAHDL